MALQLLHRVDSDDTQRVADIWEFMTPLFSLAAVK